MTQQQIKYTQARLKEILQVKLNKLVVDKRPSLNELIADGTLTIDIDSIIEACKNSSTIYRERFLLGYTKVKEEWEQEHVVLRKVREEVREEYTNIVDELMLGDTEEALKLIEKFKGE